MKLLSKLSAKDILGTVTDVVKTMDVGETIDAFAVAGICTGYETGVSTFGEWTRFVGDFQGINYTDGEDCRAPKAHVPDVLEQVIMSGIQDAATVVTEKSGKNSTFYKLDSPIEFSFKVQIIRNEDEDSGKISYKYITLPMTEVAQNDSLSHLTALIAPPKKETKKK